MKNKKKKTCFHGVEFVVRGQLSQSAVAVCCTFIYSSLGGSKSKIKKAK